MAIRGLQRVKQQLQYINDKVKNRAVRIEGNKVMYDFFLFLFHSLMNIYLFLTNNIYSFHVTYFIEVLQTLKHVTYLFRRIVV